MLLLKRVDGVAALLLFGVVLVCVGLLPENLQQPHFYLFVAIVMIMAVIIWLYYLRHRNSPLVVWLRSNASLAVFLVLANGIIFFIMLYAVFIGVFGFRRMIGAFVFSAYVTTGLTLIWEFVGAALRSILSDRKS